MLVNLSIGMYTPPFGLNLFASQAIFNQPLGSIYRGVVPFVLINLLEWHCPRQMGRSNERAAGLPRRLPGHYGPHTLPYPNRAWIEARFGRWPLRHRPLARRRWVLVAWALDAWCEIPARSIRGGR
jgi:hypothetical protein